MRPSRQGSWGGKCSPSSARSWAVGELHASGGAPKALLCCPLMCTLGMAPERRVEELSPAALEPGIVSDRVVSQVWPPVPWKRLVGVCRAVVSLAQGLAQLEPTTSCPTLTCASPSGVSLPNEKRAMSFGAATFISQ